MEQLLFVAAGVIFISIFGYIMRDIMSYLPTKGELEEEEY